MELDLCVFQAARGQVAHAGCVEPVIEPLEAMIDATDVGLVGVMLQPGCGKSSVHDGDGAVQLPACPGEDQQVVHEAHGSGRLPPDEGSTFLLLSGIRTPTLENPRIGRIVGFC